MPATVPTTVPRPPLKIVPPRTIAASASNSKPRPVKVLDTPERASTAMPPSAGEQARDHVAGEGDAGHRQPGEARRFAVAADQVDLPAEARRAQHESPTARPARASTSASTGSTSPMRWLKNSRKPGATMPRAVPPE